MDHTVVIAKAINLGLYPSLIAWLADFLSESRQAALYQGCVSSLQHLTCGVPQSAKMGLLCFLMLINYALTETPHRWKYVDDSTVGITVNTRSPDFSLLQATLDSLQTWTEVNKVSINHTKTMVINFTPLQQQSHLPSSPLAPTPSK